MLGQLGGGRVDQLAAVAEGVGAGHSREANRT
jgi:hypothetical protein